MTFGRSAPAALLALAVACAHEPRRERGGARPGVEVGVASFYAERLQGRRTASGARYDAGAFTCAHRSAPFGTRLHVTDLASGRSVVVTVNDRGPFVEGRIVDLSLAAARALGMVERGLAEVRVEPLAPSRGGQARGAGR